MVTILPFIDLEKTLKQVKYYLYVIFITIFYLMNVSVNFKELVLKKKVYSAGIRKRDVKPFIIIIIISNNN